MRNKSKKSLKNQKNNLFLIIAVLILVVINIVILIVHFSKKDSNTENVEGQQSEEVSVQEEKIEEMSEQDRIQNYARNFFISIDNEEYEKAYKVLNSDFKTKYFPTLASFEDYVKKYIGTGELTINFKNIERLGNEKTGNIYVLWVNVKDILGSIKKTSDEDEEQNYTNVVILEKNYNEYELSFSVTK